MATATERETCEVEGCDRMKTRLEIRIGKYGRCRFEQSRFCKQHEPRMCLNASCHRPKQDKPGAMWCSVHQAQQTRQSNQKANAANRRREYLEAGTIQANYGMVCRYEVTLRCPEDETVLDTFDTGLDPILPGGTKLRCIQCGYTFVAPRHYYPGSLYAPATVEVTNGAG